LRLLLDAHLSGTRIAEPLRARGHAIRTADKERELDGWTDEALLALASEAERVMVTFDVKDFPEIARCWAEAARPHAGLAIVVGIRSRRVRDVLRVLESLFEGRADRGEWSDRTCFVSRSGASRAQGSPIACGTSVQRSRRLR
jgi:predicted nuclease of predicted toxin-antitoxin system